MNQASHKTLWPIFLEKHEEDFKKMMGYGKEEIEKIGVDKFFESMGWSKEDHLSSFRSDRMHVVPCIDCGKEFAIYEENLGLCDECQKVYDIDSVFTYASSIAQDSGASVANTINTVCAAFYSDKQFRGTFRNDIADDTVTHALVRKHAQEDNSLGWRVLPLGELKEWKEKYIAGQFQLIRHDGTPMEKNGVTIFNSLDEVLV